MHSSETKDLYASGLSLSEVAKRLNISSTGVKYRLAKEGVVLRSRSDAVRIKHHKRLNSYSSVVPEIISPELYSLYIAGLALYWGEGTKVSNTVALTNSDPEMILTFLKFLRKICCVDEKRLRILIHYHTDHDERELITYWSNITGIEKSQFYVGTMHKEIVRRSTKKLKFGTISLRYSDSLLLKEILERIEQMKSEL